MERTHLFNLIGELKLYVMKAAVDEMMATAVTRITLKWSGQPSRRQPQRRATACPGTMSFAMPIFIDLEFG
jgi:hypothetical protein